MTVGVPLLPVFLAIFLTAGSVLFATVVRKVAPCVLLAALAAFCTVNFLYWSIYPLISGAPNTIADTVAIGISSNTFLYFGGSLIALASLAYRAHSLRKSNAKSDVFKKIPEMEEATVAQKPPDKPKQQPNSVDGVGGVVVSFLGALDEKTVAALAEVVAKKIKEQNLLPAPQPEPEKKTAPAEAEVEEQNTEPPLVAHEFS